MPGKALLGRVRSADGVGGHTLFGRGPGQLLWDMPQLGSIQIRVHGTSMEAHGGHIEILINESGIRMILDEGRRRPADGRREVEIGGGLEEQTSLPGVDQRRGHGGPADEHIDEAFAIASQYRDGVGKMIVRP